MSVRPSSPCSKLVVLADDAPALSVLCEFIEPKAIGGRCMSFESTQVLFFNRNNLQGLVARVVVRRTARPLGDNIVSVRTVDVIVVNSEDDLRHYLQDSQVLHLRSTDQRQPAMYTFTHSKMFPKPPSGSAHICQFETGHLQSHLRNLVSVLYSGWFSRKPQDATVCTPNSAIAQMSGYIGRSTLAFEEGGYGGSVQFGQDDAYDAIREDGSRL
ncbi:MAG: hypothetical protein Q8P90_01675 [bacterium]|nr:hypothetical protein [bacterium]